MLLSWQRKVHFYFLPGDLRHRDPVQQGGAEGRDAGGLHPGRRGVPHRQGIQLIPGLHHREGHRTAAVRPTLF